MSRRGGRSRSPRDYDHVVLHTSTPSFRADVRTAAGASRTPKPDTVIGFVGGHVTARPEESLRFAGAIDYVGAQGVRPRRRRDRRGPPARRRRRASASCASGAYVHNDEPAPLTTEQLDALPFVTDVYARDLDYKKYNSPYCQYPYVSLYTGRGCPARCTFCLWPQVTTGHSYRTRSVGNVLEECAHMQRLFPEMKELFFDDDTFTADPKRAVRDRARASASSASRWSTNSRANVDRETLKVLKDDGLRLFVVGYESGNEQILQEHQEGRRASSAPGASPATATTSAS